MARKKKDDVQGVNTEAEEKSGNKLFSMFVVIFIVLIWLAIFALLIKADVGGLGSNVLRPVLKDIPVVNEILPKASDQEFFDENNVSYDSLEGAVKRINELEQELKSIKESNSGYEDEIKDLEAEKSKLSTYQEDNVDLEERIKEFDEKVVFNDKAPTIEEYEAYYSEMNPENAEEIYRQVVEQIQYNQKMQDEADRYAKMEPASAAKILEIMSSDDLDTVCGIISCMNKTKAGLIMAELDPVISARITNRLMTKED